MASSDGYFADSDGHTRGFRRIVVLLVFLVTVPTVVLLVVGILMLVFYEANLNLVFGIMVVTIVVAMLTGSFIALVLLRREARLSQLQSDFVSKVSHELRTPLTSIRMFVETLEMNRVPPEQRQACLTGLSVETARLTDRIERLLDWGRMEAGKRAFELEVGRPEAVVREALEAFEATIVGRKIAVEVDVQPGLPPVRLDRGAVVEALVNLLSNAYKYTGEDKRISLSAAADGRWLRLSVKDNGIGIPRSEHRRIFQKFYRVDERLSRAAEGTGLGLSIVKHVARAHAGRVEVESELGQGSVFSLLIPLPAAERKTKPRVEETHA